MNFTKINWESNYLVPRFLKDFLTEDLYKTKFIHNFTIVSMLRNYTTTDLKTQKDVHSIIVNKNLITKSIETSNLTTRFEKKNLEVGSPGRGSILEQNNVEVYKLLIHINNKFNPTNIDLFDTKSKVHFYHFYGDNTLHLNMGLLTFFKILSTPSIKIKARKSNYDDDYYIPN